MTGNALEDIAKTSIWTLRARSEEHLQPHALFRDEQAIEWSRQIPWPSELDEWYTHRAQTGVCIRTKVFDDLVQKHIETMNHPLVVELGCGLSSRYHRIGTGCTQWIDFDLPDVIRTRRELDPETEEHRYLAGSLLDYSWLQKINQEHQGGVILVAEGLLMYFEPEQVLQTIEEMKQHFPGAIFIFDTLGKKAKQIGEKFTLRANAPLKWVVKNKRNVHALPLKIFNVTSLFEHYKQRLGIARLMYWVPAVRNMNLFVESQLV